MKIDNLKLKILALSCFAFLFLIYGDASPAFAHMF